jgi:DNA-binding MarR family transcriptional regulator
MTEAVGEQLGVVTALVRVTFLVDAVYAEAARDHGMTHQQGQLVCVLMAQPYGMSELGGILRLAKSSLTGLVDRTAERGLVVREPDPEDGRAVRVALTGEGAEVARMFHTEACRRLEALPGGLGEADRAMLAGLLSRMVLDNEVPAVFG